MVKKIFVAALFLTGCTAAVPSESLRFEVTEEPTSLQVQAFDAQNAVIGQLALDVGSFVVPELEGTRPARELTLSVRGSLVRHVSATATAVNLPSTGNPAIDAFLAQAPVTKALSRWSVGIDVGDIDPSVLTAPPVSEVPYLCNGLTAHNYFEGSSCGACTYAPTGDCAGSACAGWPGASGVTQYQFVDCQFVTTMVKRACSTANSSNACGTTGPAGCSVCWNQFYDETCPHSVGGTSSCYSRSWG